MSDIRDKVAEIMYLSDYNTTSKYHCNELADQIHALYTVPSIWLECDACGGRGEVPDFLTSHANVTDPCTCKDGKREYRPWWELPEGHYWCVAGTDTITNSNEPRLLHATDLFNAVIREALTDLTFDAMHGQGQVKEMALGLGRLVLKEVK